MKVTYDGIVDAAYIYLTYPIGAGQVKKTYACNPIKVGGQIHLDFDIDGNLVGVEVLDACRLLPKELLDRAEIRSNEKE
jgi:uncharacterized protein YuzE